MASYKDDQDFLDCNSRAMLSCNQVNIEIQSQEIIYLTTTNKLQSHLPFSFFKKQEDPISLAILFYTAYNKKISTTKNFLYFQSEKDLLDALSALS